MYSESESGGSNNLGGAAKARTVNCSGIGLAMRCDAEGFVDMGSGHVKGDVEEQRARERVLEEDIWV